MKPDVIVTWPRNCDYPLWREYIRDNRSRFNEIVIVFMETNQGDDYRDFVRKAMFYDRALCVETPPNYEGDWRNAAVNAGLQHSLHSEWVWFTEQDFFPGPEFWNKVEECSTKHDYIGIKEGDRLHPACLFMKRALLNETRKDFSIVPGKLDHFGLIAEDLLTKNGAILSPDYYIHMAGLSHNLSLIARSEAPNHNIEQFKEYCKACLKLSVDMPVSFEVTLRTYLATTTQQPAV